jgi:uncharacterized protein YjbI with pentapeptide repeats/tetratricopeptide (TPR) repeat protein
MAKDAKIAKLAALPFQTRLRGADLRAVDLRLLRLDGIDLSGADLRGVDLRGGNLRGSDLSGARLDGADLRGADLRDVVLAGASLRDVDAVGARFDRSVAPDALAIGLQASDASFFGAEWPRARLSLANFENADLRGARFDGCSLETVRFVHANLGRAVLDDTALDGADFSHARARSLALRAAQGRFSLTGADLRGADLREVRLAELPMEGANLAGARVDRAIARRHGTLLRTLGWAPAFELQRTAAVLVRLRALRPLEWLEAWRRRPDEATEDAAPDAEGAVRPAEAAAPAAAEEARGVAEAAPEATRKPPAEVTEATLAADEAVVDTAELQEAFAQAAFERERERQRRAASADSDMRRRLVQAIARKRAEAEAHTEERRRELAELGPSETPSEIRDSFRDQAASRDRQRLALAAARDTQARAVASRAVRAAQRALVADAERKAAAAREEAAAQAEQAWRQRLEAVRQLQEKARADARAELEERARREREAAEAEAAARAAEAAALAAQERALEAARKEAEEARAREAAAREAELQREQAQREAQSRAEAMARSEAEAERLRQEAALAEASREERLRAEAEAREAALLAQREREAAEAAARAAADAAAREAAEARQREAITQAAAAREAEERTRRERELVDAALAAAAARAQAEREAAARAVLLREEAEQAAARRDAEDDRDRERALAEAREADEHARREEANAARASETARRAEGLALAAAHRRAAETRREYSAQLVRASVARAHEARRRTDLQAAREREERLRREAEERAEIQAREAELRRSAEESRRLAAERARLEAEEEDRARALAAAEARARAAEQARAEAELRAQQEKEARARREAARAAAAEAEAAERARKQAEAEVRRLEEERRAAEIASLRAAEENARRETKEAAARARLEAEEEAKARALAIAEARARAAEQARAEADLRAQQEKAARARREAERVAAAEAEAAEQARRQQEAEARRQEEARRAAEIAALRAAEESARREEREAVARVVAAARAASAQRAAEEEARRAEAAAHARAAAARRDRLVQLARGIEAKGEDLTRRERAVLLERMEVELAARLEARAEDRDEATARAAAAGLRALTGVGLAAARRARAAGRALAARVRARAAAARQDWQVGWSPVPEPAVVASGLAGWAEHRRQKAASLRELAAADTPGQALLATRARTLSLLAFVGGLVAALGGLAVAAWRALIVPLSDRATQTAPRLRALLERLEPPPEQPVDDLQAAQPLEVVKAGLRRVGAVLEPWVVRARRVGSLPLRELGRVRLRAAVRGAVTRLLADDATAEVPVAELEEGLDFAYDANARQAALQLAATAALTARTLAAREANADRVDGGARLRGLADARTEKEVQRNTEVMRAAYRAVRAVRYNAAVAPGSVAEAAQRQIEEAERRSLADELRRAQFARETELKRRREEAGLKRLDLELRTARAQLDATSRESVVDLPTLSAQRARVAAAEEALDAQRGRLAAVTTAQKQAAESTVADRRRRVVRALTAGVGFVRGRFGADLAELVPGAELSRRSLDELDLRGRDLQNARLVGCTLVGTDLRGADLRGANLSEVDLTGARLEGTRFDGAVLDDAIIDQVNVEGATFAGVSAAGARLGSIRGLTPELRAVLVAAGAETSTSGDWRGLGLAAGAVLLTAAVGGGFFVFGRYDADRLDDGSLEQAAGVARADGRTEDAVAAFSLLAERATTAQTQADYWLEAATAAEDADDREGALLTLEKAVAAAVDTPEYPRVLIARAQAWNRLALAARAETEFRSLIARADLSPDQAATAIVGLRASMGTRGAEEVAAIQSARLRDAPTDQGRASLAMALADAWAAANDLDAGRAALREGLAGVTAEEERLDIQLRLARAEADSGDVAGALAIFASLEGGTADGEARLGAAGLLERMGRVEEASAKIKPLLTARNPDIRARALYTTALTAERAGNDAEALGLVRTLLGLDGVPPDVLDGARILLARLDPTAVDDLVADNPGLVSELLIGRAQALRERGEHTDARALYVQVAEGDGDIQVRVDARLALAELDAEGGDFEGAIARYDTLLGVTELGRDTRARVSLARSTALLASNRIQEAEAGFRALILGSTPEVQDQCRLGLARAAELRGQLKNASELYLVVGRGSGPWAIEALLSLGRMREGAGDLPGAIEAYRLARARPGGESSRRAAADIALAQALAASGEGAEAATVYASLLENTDAVVRTQARLAVAEARLADDPAAAFALMETALADAGKDYRGAVRALWIEAALRSGKESLVQTRLEAWVDTEGDAGARDELVSGAIRGMRAQAGPEAAAVLARRWPDAGFESSMEAALTFREMGDLPAAQAQLARMAPASLDDRRWRDEVYADVLSEVGELDAADRVWEQLQSVDPSGASFGRGRVARMRGDHEAALRLLAASSDPRAPEERGLALEALGRPEEAAAAYALLVSSEDLERRTAGRVGQARLRLQADDPSGALSVLGQLSGVDPGYALTVAQLRADALLGLERVAEARDVFAALEGDGEVASIRTLGLADCALAAGDDAEARRLFFEAFRTSTDRYYKADALAGLVRALVEADKRDAAADRLAELRKDYPERPDAIARAEAALGG